MHRHLFAVLLLSASCHALAADFSGTYQCHLTDHRDGPFDGTLILKRDEQATMRDTGYGSYLIDLKVKGIPYTYTGIAAARGNDLAIYFESVGEKRDADDRGVGIASVILDQDKKGKNTVSIHKFYYEKSYKGASNYGFEWCTKTK
jgi:hypothetical protein